MLSAAKTDVKLSKECQPVLFDIQRKSTSLCKSIDELVGALTDPLIVPGSAWSSSIPPWLRQHVIFARMIDLMKTKGDVTMATDAEACAYLMPLTLDAPMSHEWAEIYLYVSTVTCRSAGKEVPADVAVEKLDNYTMEELHRLKRWIYQRRFQARKARQRAERKSESENISEIRLGGKQDFSRGHGEAVCTQNDASETDNGFSFGSCSDLFGEES